MISSPREKWNVKEIKLAWLSAHDPSASEHLYWSTAGPTGGFSIIGFAGEFKKDDNDSNKNQVIMALATAQLQRKAFELRVPSSWGLLPLVAACRFSPISHLSSRDVGLDRIALPTNKFWDRNGVFQALTPGNRCYDVYHLYLLTCLLYIHSRTRWTMMMIGNMKKERWEQGNEYPKRERWYESEVQLECAQTGTGGEELAVGKKWGDQRGTTDGPPDVTATPKNA